MRTVYIQCFNILQASKAKHISGLALVCGCATHRLANGMQMEQSLRAEAGLGLARKHSWWLGFQPLLVVWLPLIRFVP